MNSGPTFHFVTLFPQTIEVWFSTSILGRALSAGLYHFQTYQLRDYATDKHKVVDDTPYGGGGGMVLKVEPLVSAVEHIKSQIGSASTKVILFSPRGKSLNQKLLVEFRPLEGQHFILICGHYEGVDQRFIDGWVDMEISLGDFVMTGGEIPAIAFADALTRTVRGALGNSEATQKESFVLTDPISGCVLLEYPQYTRPFNFRNMCVPGVLISGNHEQIAKWRHEQAICKTAGSRPDLLKPLLSPEEH
ncbi:MAG: tRNA (guanosine(37)-N1)-methyltransferase TrmD [Deltaproteobacteria bacterium]|nr:tRNA (guanosine(37)-N1)-methyltransferase TrmD [Deltaproteobacteria bacterium]